MIHLAQPFFKCTFENANKRISVALFGNTTGKALKSQINFGLKGLRVDQLLVTNPFFILKVREILIILQGIKQGQLCSSRAIMVCKVP